MILIRKSIYLLICILSLSHVAYAQSKKDTVNIGFYVNDIYDIDYKKGSYKISLFIWSNSKKDFYDLEKYLDFKGSISKTLNYTHNEKVYDSIYWSEISLQLEILESFNAKNFPFDDENLNLFVEFTYDDSDSLYIKHDKKSILDEFKLPNDWKLKNEPSINIFTEVYNTAFGDPRIDKFKINTAHLSFHLSRNRFGLFLKLFVALFISFLIASSSIFISNKNFESRFSLIVGGLFGTISNKYITDNYLPESTSLGLSDKLHLLTIFFILILTVATIIENRFKLEDNVSYERITFSSIIIGYILFVILFILTV